MNRDLPAARDAVIREHMESENRLDFDVTIATFDHLRYELVGTGQVFDGEELDNDCVVRVAEGVDLVALIGEGRAAPTSEISQASHPPDGPSAAAWLPSSSSTATASFVSGSISTRARSCANSA